MFLNYYRELDLSQRLGKHMSYFASLQLRVSSGLLSLILFRFHFLIG